MRKYTFELTFDEITMIRSALEYEAERRMAYNAGKANAFYDLYKTFEQMRIDICNNRFNEWQSDVEDNDH